MNFKFVMVTSAFKQSLDEPESKEPFFIIYNSKLYEPGGEFLEGFHEAFF
jgi:hypothetical protein